MLNYFIFLSATAGEHSACSGTHKSTHDQPQQSLPFYFLNQYVLESHVELAFETCPQLFHIYWDPHA